MEVSKKSLKTALRALTEERARVVHILAGVRNESIAAGHVDHLNDIDEAIREVRNAI